MKRIYLLRIYTFGDLPHSSINFNIYHGMKVDPLEKGQSITAPYGLIGEIGHSSVAPFGKKCSSGNNSCLKQYVLYPTLIEVPKDNNIDIHNIREE